MNSLETQQHRQCHPLPLLPPARLRSAQSIRVGAPSHELRAGRGFWEGLAGDAAKGAVFDAAMGSFKDLGGASVVAGYDW
jgi:hypothetical protein